jgi:branched-chain amino acid transport system permease protein
VRIRVALGVTAAFVLVAPPFALSTAHITRFATVGAYTIAVLAVGLLARESGRLSLGHGAFMAVGGYTTALLAEHGVSLVAAVPAAAGAGAAAGVVLALPVAGRPGRYLALPTLGAALALGADLDRYPAVVLPHPLGATAAYAVDWVLAGLLVGAAVVLRPQFRRLPGGADVACSAAGAGLAGGLLVLVVGHAGAASFPTSLSLLLVAAAALGFYGAPWAAPLGALALVYVPDLAEREHAGYGPMLFVFGVALIALMLASPLVRRLGRRVQRGVR